VAPFAHPGQPAVLGGRVLDGALDALHLRFADGTTVDVVVEAGGYWLAELAGAAAAAARDGGGRTEVVPLGPLRDEEGDGGLDHLQPIFTSTVSDEDDLTLVLGVSGRVHVAGAVRLELVYPDGTAQPVPLAADGSFELALPPERW
jgi:hypothetical protein